MSTATDAASEHPAAVFTEIQATAEQVA